MPETTGSLTEKQPPYGPYYLASDKQHGKATTIVWNSLQTQLDVFASRFERADISTATAAVLNPVTEAGAPILYYLANPAPRDTDGNGIESWDIYDYADNYLITDLKPSTPTLAPDVVALGDRLKHPLYAPSNGKPGPSFGITRPSGALAPATPYNADSFILISPGMDGIYFTADDISNFK